MNRLFVIAAMVVVLSGGLVSASPAHADPRITISSSKGASARPLQHRYNLRLPALRNAKPKARRTFTTIVRGVVDQQYRFLIKWRNRYNPTPQCNNRTKNSMFRARTRKGIIGRYAMATITVNTWPACGGVDHAVARTINLDLRTGRSLRLDNLIDRVWPGRFVRALDLCTGSGAIALSLALATDAACVRIVASDISAWNFRRHGPNP